MKKIICLLAVLCMMLPVTVLGEATLSSVYPDVKTMSSSYYYEAKAIMEGLLRDNYDGCVGHYWYYVESSVNEEVLYEVYLELAFEDNRFINIIAVYSSSTEYPLIIVEYNGEAPSDEIIADYANLGMNVIEIQDEDDLNCHVQFAMDID